MKPQTFALMVIGTFLTPGAGAGPLVDQYFPMNNGDSRYYQYYYNPPYRATEVFTQANYNGRSVFALNFHDEWDGYPFAIETWYLGNNGAALALYGIHTGWGDLPLNSPANLMTDQMVSTNGTITSHVKGVLYGLTVDVTIKATLSSIAGPVTVPAGTFYNCKQLLVWENATYMGASFNAYDSAAWILAPGVGIIKDGVAYWDVYTKQFRFYDDFGKPMGYLELISTTYTPPVAAAPVFNPPPGPFNSTITVRASTATAGAKIRYTTNGSEPLTTSTIFPSTGLVFRATTTLKAKTFKAGVVESATTTGTYTRTDLLGPVLTITTPTNNATPTGPNLPQLLVKGTATDNGRGNNGIASVTVNGVAAGGASVSAGTKAFWSASVTLTTGQNTITVIAKDALNNASQKSISVNCPFGKEIGSFNGVPAYSNGSVANDSQIRISTGLEWQCVEYVNRYYSVVYGMDLTAIRENAYQFFDNAALLGLQPFPNSGAVRPEIGDILCFKGGASGLGHVAIIREVGTNFVNAIQQNLKNDAKANSLKYNMSVNSGHYRISNATLGTNYICQGWLRKPAATGRLTITGIKRSQVENQGNLGALKQPWPAVAGPNQQQPLRLHFAGREGEPCALQTSTNLVDWQTVRTFVGTDSGVSFDEVFEPALGSHFYRVVAP